MQRRMSPTTRICAFWSAPVKRRSSIRRLFCTGTALNLAVDEHRRSRVRRAEPLEVLDDEEGLASPSPQTVVDQGQRLDNLQRALAELPAICRSSFLSRKLDGLSHSQIAEHLTFPAAWWKSTSSTR